MGGSGGGGAPPIIGGGRPQGDPCIMNFDVALVAVDPSVAKGVLTGQILPVVLQTANGVDIVAVTTGDGKRLGAVNSSETLQLIDCMKNGRQYVARVLKTGSPPSVRIQNQ